MAETIILPMKWNAWLIVLSYVIGFVGSYTATYLLFMLERSETIMAKRLWLMASCLSFGGASIWSLHFTGMMAMDLGLIVTYEPVLTILSFVIAVSGALLSFYVKFRNIFTVTVRHIESLDIVPLLDNTMLDNSIYEDVSLIQIFIVKDLSIIAGGLFMTTAIGGMHYTGMWAMRIENVQMHFNLWIIFLSVLVGWIICSISINALPRVIDIHRQTLFAVLSSGAVFILHYLGMYAVHFTIDKDHLPSVPVSSFGWIIPLTIIIIVSITSFLVLSVVFFEKFLRRYNNCVFSA